MDVNEAALAALAADAPEIRTVLTPARALPFEDGAFDLVFTTGVLIHQPPETLPVVIDEIVRCSARFVVCGEYFADSLEEVPYRGHTGALFRGISAPCTWIGAWKCSSAGSCRATASGTT